MADFKAAVEPKLPISILDTDLYKLTMQQAVLEHYPTAEARYCFTNRRKSDRFSRAAFEWAQDTISRLDAIRLLPDERAWLETKCPYFKPAYLDYLSQFRLQPSKQVEIRFVPEDGETEWGSIELDVFGRWSETILYEVPLMSILSEAHFVKDDTKWDYVGQKENAYQKGKRFFETGCLVAEFGTRRRRTYNAQKLAMEGLIKAHQEVSARPDAKGKLTGTSNVHFAHLFDLAPIGTIAHEWIMGVAAIEGYEGSNGVAMDKWDKTYPDGQLSIALTDTFSSGPFFDDFVKDVGRAQRWRGLRQDSGDPKAFSKRAKEVYEGLGIDAKTKTIVFSDGLTPDKVVELYTFSQELGIGCSFGVGTNFTNDFKQIESPVPQDAKDLGEGPVAEPTLPESKALNIVIKLWWIDGKPCVKISDELTKNSGVQEAVKLVKDRFGLEK